MACQSVPPYGGKPRHALAELSNTQPEGKPTGPVPQVNDDPA